MPCTSLKFCFVPKRFYLTHPRRMRWLLGLDQTWRWVLQFTHPRRVRPTSQFEKYASRTFQFRTCEGCDNLFLLFGIVHFAVSIHAPAEGATEIDRALVVAPKFQFTHPWKVLSICLSKNVRDCSLNSHLKNT